MKNEIINSLAVMEWAERKLGELREEWMNGDWPSDYEWRAKQIWNSLSRLQALRNQWEKQDRLKQDQQEKV